MTREIPVSKLWVIRFSKEKTLVVLKVLLVVHFKLVGWSLVNWTLVLLKQCCWCNSRHRSLNLELALLEWWHSLWLQESVVKVRLVSYILPHIKFLLIFGKVVWLCCLVTFHQTLPESVLIDDQSSLKPLASCSFGGSWFVFVNSVNSFCIFVGYSHLLRSLKYGKSTLADALDQALPLSVSNFFVLPSHLQNI